MEPQKETQVCQHCGTKIEQSSEAWIGIMEDSDSGRCPGCREPADNRPVFDHKRVEKPKSRKFNLTFFIISILLLGLMVYLNRIFNVLSVKKDLAHLAYAILLIVIISSALASGKVWKKFKHLTIWAVIFIIFIVGYSYRFELAGVKDKVMMELAPSKGYQESPDSVSFPVSPDGHFYIHAEVNGVSVRFLADTGASSIVLSPGDAAKVGIEMNGLKFDRIYETANGIVRGSSVRIADLKIKGIHLRNINGSVNGAEMSNSLLGMTFFKRLKSYEVKNDVLTLYWDGDGK